MEVFKEGQYQLLVDLMMNQDGFIKHNHFVSLEIQKGYAKAEIEVTEGMLNPRGGVHGGSLFAICDTVGGLAAMSYGHVVTSTTGTISYVRPANDTHLYAETSEIKAGSNLARYDVVIKDSKDQILCKAMMEYFILGPLMVEDGKITLADYIK